MTKKHIENIRSFNRFYTTIIGLLDNHILDSSYSLPEVRVLYEINHNPGVTSTAIISLTGMDKGYLSRVLQQLEKNRLIKKSVSATDKRVASLSLTAKGVQEFKTLNESSNKQVTALFKHLSDNDCNRLVQCMTTIKDLLKENQL